MEIISKILFGIANSLLIPDIVLLIIFLVYALIMAGGTYSSYMTRRRNNKLFNDKIKSLTKANLDELKALLPQKPNSLFVAYLADLLNTDKGQDYADYMLTNYETEAAKDLHSSKILTKIGPILGLVGTLISMSPALVGLSSGDISGMAYNMQVVFATTVVGLLISSIGLVTEQMKSRWYAADINNLDYVAKIKNEKQGGER